MDSQLASQIGLYSSVGETSGSRSSLGATLTMQSVNNENSSTFLDIIPPPFCKFRVQPLKTSLMEIMTKSRRESKVQPDILRRKINNNSLIIPFDFK
jgi:hypothetical protein